MLRHNLKPLYSRTRSGVALAMCVCLLLVGFSSCQRERDTWGQEFVPEGEKLHVYEHVTTNFEAWTDTTASVAYPRFVQAPLGETYDPIFGRRRAYFLTQLVPDKLSLPNYEMGKTQLDSAFFSFRVESAYQNEPIVVKLSRMNQNIVPSDSAHTLAQHRDFTPIAEMELVPSDKAWVKIPLDRTEMARGLLDSASKHLKTFADFLTFFKGVRLDAVRKTTGKNIGSIAVVNVGDAKTGFFFYWKHNDSVRSLRLGVVSNGKRFSAIDHDYSDATLKQIIAQPHDAQDQAGQSYIGSAGDVRTWLDFTRLYQQWRDSMPVSVLRAELRVPFAQANVPYSDTLVSKLFAVLKLGSEETAVPDIDKGAALYNGYYNRKEGYFSLNLTYTVQGLLLGQIPEHRLAFFGDSRYYGFGRAIIANGRSTPQPMQLIITYTKH